MFHVCAFCWLSRQQQSLHQHKGREFSPGLYSVQVEGMPGHGCCWLCQPEDQSVFYKGGQGSLAQAWPALRGQV